MTASGAPEISRLAFPHRWRHYQEMVLAAFENDRRHGRTSTYVVAPPGSGKTLLGMEMVRRLGTRALVLVPNTAVQQQWLRAASEFGAAPGVAATDTSAPIACLTYQALCQLDDPAACVGDVAGRRWAAERANATGSTAAQVQREAAGWTGEAGALFGVAGRALASTRDVLVGALPLDLVAHAICDAYRELGELTEAAAASLAIEPRAAGYLRCYLRSATAEESDRFAQALDQAISPVDFPRYLISRLVPAPSGRGQAARRLLTGKASYDRRWVAVPDDFGRSKRRAEVYAGAWRRWLGPAELQFTQRSEAGREAAAGAGAQASDYQTSSRQIWV